MAIPLPPYHHRQHFRQKVATSLTPLAPALPPIPLLPKTMLLTRFFGVGSLAAEGANLATRAISYGIGWSDRGKWECCAARSATRVFPAVRRGMRTRRSKYAETGLIMHVECETTLFARNMYIKQFSSDQTCPSFVCVSKYMSNLF